MTCLSVEVEQYDMQRSMDMKEKKKKRAVTEPQYLNPYWKQQKMLESSTVEELCQLQKVHADLCQGHLASIPRVCVTLTYSTELQWTDMTK